MADIFKKTFVMVDVDGTLLCDNHLISDKNKNAISEFVLEGGLFTIATGRGVSMAKPIIEELKLEIPAVIFNGAAIYDCKEGEIIWHTDLPDDAFFYLSEIHKEFPTAAIEVLRYDDVYVACSNSLEEHHLALGNVTPIRQELDEIPKKEWIKSLIVDEPENIDRMISFIEKRGFKNVHWVRSSPIYYEMLPKNVNKGTGLRKLTEIMSEENRYIVGVGDYMNDIEMLEMADLGVAVGNAQPSVKKAADLIVSDNNNHAVYDVINYLKNTKKDGM